jgi:hypothetical protein
MAVANRKSADVKPLGAETRPAADVRLVDSWFADFQKARAAGMHEDRATQICRELANKICQILAAHGSLSAEGTPKDMRH